MKYVRREAVKACSIHQAIHDRCAEALVDKGCFNKDEILRGLGFDVIADSVRWDYLQESLEQMQGVELIPVAADFFKRHSAVDLQTVPERFLAIGRAKRTAGYASITTLDGNLVIRRLKQKNSVMNGAAKAFEVYRQKIEHRRPELIAPPPVPLVEGPTK